jgi:cell wall-associated NlpC family hydrolase
MSPDRMNISATPTPMSSRQQVVDAARAWLGTRWVHQGRAKAGIDCAGLLIKVHEDLGLPVTDMAGYRRSPDGKSFLEHIRSQTVPAAYPLPGTIGIFRQSNFPCHTGIFAEKNGVVTLIHAYAGAGKVIEEPFIHDWPILLVQLRDIIGIIE